MTLLQLSIDSTTSVEWSMTSRITLVSLKALVVATTRWCLLFLPHRSWRKCYAKSLYIFLAHLSRWLTRWAYRMGLELASVRLCLRPCVRASTLSNMNLSENSRPITIKFHHKHHWGGGKAALGFGADQIRTLVSMATDSSHRVIMGKRAS